MSRRKKQTAVSLPVFLNEENKMTFSQFRFVKKETENEKGEKVHTLGMELNPRAKDKYGDDYDKPMNRAARRQKARTHRLYVKRYGERSLVKKEEQNGDSVRTEGNTETDAGTEATSNQHD